MSPEARLFAMPSQLRSSRPVKTKGRAPRPVARAVPSATRKTVKTSIVHRNLTTCADGRRACSARGRSRTLGAVERQLSTMRLMPDATNAADVILRDGSTLRLRPPEMKDADALLEFFRGLSERSLYLRFHGFPSLRPELVEPLLEPDWVERGALVGTLTRDGTERVVAVGNYVRLRDPVLAEAAFAVDDEHQGRGVGTRLLEQLAERAAEVGIQRFVAEVMADNRTMLGVFGAAGFELTRELAGGEVEVEFPIAPT